MSASKSNEPYTRVAVIMAGGAGERFWPLSRQARPKQLLKLTHPELTLLEESVQRIAPLIPSERIYIATARSLVEPIRAARVGVSDENILGEPCKRNTAGCLCYAAAAMLARHGERVSMAVLTADHRIGAPDRFRATAAAALDAAENAGALVTIGVPPERPDTGLGYIEARTLEPLGGLGDSNGIVILPVGKFHEKPKEEVAREYLAGGRYFWNSGMFFWTISDFLRELDGVSPGHAAAVRVMAAAFQNKDEQTVEASFAELPDISIDYALMERAGKVLMARAEFPWDDVGAWDALDRGWERDADGNVCLGEPVVIDSAGNIIYNEPGASEVSVAAIGVHDLIIVVSRDGVLVAPKSRAQDVRRAVAELKARGASHV